MKLLLLLLVGVTAVLAVPTDITAEELKLYPRYIEFPDGDGVLHTVDLQEEPDHELLNEITSNADNNVYLLFTRQNPTTPQTLVINDASSIQSSFFDPNLPTVVIVHGWLSNQNTNLNPIIRDAYLGQMNANVIVMDWRRLALSGYVTAARGVPAVGKGLGQFLNFLNEVTGARYELMHLVGFSLGAHVVGNAGRETGGQVARVTGLDPAGPLWNLNSQRLNANDGRYVECIHTDGGYTVGGLGFGRPLGDVDFFPNGGVSQPGCLTNICNHNRAWEFFAATVSYDHLVGRRCDSNLQLNLNLCRGDELKMGNSNLFKTGSGTYRVNTGRRYPF